jgi:hypothetical protein
MFYLWISFHRFIINKQGIFRYSSSSSDPVYTRHVDSSSLGFSLSSYRQSYIVLSLPLVLSINNKQQGTPYLSSIPSTRSPGWRSIDTNVHRVFPTSGVLKSSDISLVRWFSPRPGSRSWWSVSCPSFSVCIPWFVLSHTFFQTSPPKTVHTVLHYSSNDLQPSNPSSHDPISDWQLKTTGLPVEGD